MYIPILAPISIIESPGFTKCLITLSSGSLSKDDEHSSVQEIQDQERVDEIARMISGETVTPEALDFAKELFESLQCASS